MTLNFQDLIYSSFPFVKFIILLIFKNLAWSLPKTKKMMFLFWIFVLRIEAQDDSDYPSYNLCKIFDEDMFAKMLPDMGLGMSISEFGSGFEAR